MKSPDVPEVRFELWSGADGCRGSTERYAFLDGTLVSNTPLTDFEPFRLQSSHHLHGDPSEKTAGPWAPARSPQGSDKTWPPEDRLELLFEDEVLLGDVSMPLRCLGSEHGLRLAGPDAELEIDRDGRRIRARLLGGEDQGPSSEKRPGLRTFIGNAWVVSATFRDWLVLHAGAVSKQGRVFGFIGPSGAGKSTLSEALGRRSGYRQVADDMLACTAAPDGSGFQASPRFPQPALGSRGADLLRFSTPRLDIHSLYFLSPAEPGETVRLEKLAPSRAAGLLTSSIVGLPWMNPSRVAQVLDALAELTATVPCFRLTYPHEPDSVRLVAEVLDD